MKDRSQQLTDFLKQEIEAQNGFISFAHFMDAVLYHSQWGYYHSPYIDIGKLGDFTTAPEISSLFAKCFANEIHSLFTQLNKKNILEIGAGTGRFANDVLQALEKKYSPCDHYYIYEISSSLRNKQQAFLKKSIPHLFSKITWLDELPKNFSGIIIANEVLDAVPTHCFRIEKNMIKERCVTYHNQQFEWKLNAICDSEFEKKILHIKKNYPLPIHYESEINLNLSSFIKNIAENLTQGVILFVDYGYSQKEFYHPERTHGTLTCFYQHQMNQNPFIHLGYQDITSHVDFTNVIECAAHHHGELLGYTTQAAFLLSNGLAELTSEEEKYLSQAEQVNLHHAIKLLTLPTEMGERIKVMAIGKKVQPVLQGFQLADRRREL